MSKFTYVPTPVRVRTYAVLEDLKDNPLPCYHVGEFIYCS